MDEEIKQSIRQMFKRATLYQILACLADVVQEKQSKDSAWDCRQIPDKIRKFREELWKFIGSGD